MIALLKHQDVVEERGKLGLRLFELLAAPKLVLLRAGQHDRIEARLQRPEHDLRVPYERIRWISCWLA